MIELPYMILEAGEGRTVFVSYTLKDNNGNRFAYRTIVCSLNTLEEILSDDMRLTDEIGMRGSKEWKEYIGNVIKIIGKRVYGRNYSEK